MSKMLDFVSMYMHEAVAGAHRITLTLQEATLGHYKGTMALDPNLCTIGAFGDTEGCTKMAIRSVEVEGTVMKTYDQAGLRRQLTQLRSEAMGEDRWALIEFDRADSWYLVVHTADGRGWVVPLLPTAAFVKPAVAPHPAEPTAQA